MLTLFRQSRHSSALFSEGTYPCPFRFTASGIDNDWVRACETSGWIETLRNARVLYEKAGGYLWMHRDVRIGLQCWLETLWLKEITFDETLKASNAFLGDLRARTHLWIGDWYFKAFAASAHVTPVIECIYHRLQTARFARWSRPRHLSYDEDGKTLLNHRIVLFKSAVMEVLKTLVLGRPWLKLWLASPTVGPMWSRDEGGELTALEDDLVTCAGTLSGQLKNVDKDEENAAGLVQLVRKAIFEMEDVGRAIVSEGGGQQQKLYAIPDIADASADVGTIVVSHQIAAVAAEGDIDPNFQAGFRRLDATRVKEYIDTVADRQKKGGYDAELAAHKAEWLLTAGKNSLHVHAIVWLLGEYAYFIVRRAKLEFHAKDAISTSLWQKVCVTCNVGIDICKHFPIAYLRDEMLFKVKLHELYALALANLSRFFEAQRHLNEARAILTKAEIPVDDSELAMLCLRRAELLISLCYWIKQTINGTNALSLDECRTTGFVWGDDLWRFCDADMESRTTDGLVWNARVLREVIDTAGDRNIRIVPSLVSECLRNASNHADFMGRLNALHAATLDDAWIDLDRAEAHLAGTSHSTLWWGRLATLRLRVYGELPADEKAALCSLAFRKEHGDDAIARWFERGVRITSLDASRRLRIVAYFLTARAKYSVLFEKRESLARHDEDVQNVLNECRYEIENMGTPPLLASFFAKVTEQWRNTPRGAWSPKEKNLRPATPTD